MLSEGETKGCVVASATDFCVDYIEVVIVFLMGAFFFFLIVSRDDSHTGAGMTYLNKED
jgi:hypothetical protein